MNPNSPDHHALESLLRHYAALPPLPDNGFAARVLTALPPPRPAAFVSRRTILCLAGALAGVALSFQSGGARPTVSELLGRIGEVTFRVGSFLVEPRQCLMLLVVAASVAFAFRSSRDPSAEEGS